MKQIVVGVDELRRAHGAMDWACAEATRMGAAVQIVKAHTALHDLAPVELPASVEPPADEVLTTLEHWAESYRSRAKILRPRVASGSPVYVLLDSLDSDTTALLVVGHRGVGPAGRIFVGSNSVTVAGKSPVPVVVVPDQWSAEGLDHAPIVVGLCLAAGDDQVLEYAFGRAVDLGAPLTAVHAWDLPPLYSLPAAFAAGDAARDDGTQLKDMIARSADRLLEPWRARHPEVDIDLRLVIDRPVGAVLDASEGAQLTVLGRHDGAFRRGGLHLGSTVRGVLHHLRSPVVVLPLARPGGHGATSTRRTDQT
ncbi:MAG: universal stress protein [Nocardioides sp.]